MPHIIYIDSCISLNIFSAIEMCQLEILTLTTTYTCTKIGGKPASLSLSWLHKTLALPFFYTSGVTYCSTEIQIYD
jgi:hypothetical protein